MRVRRLLWCLVLFSLLPNLASALGSADETAALLHSKFTNPIVLHIDRDGVVGAQRLGALNGVSNFGPTDLNQVGGLNDFPPCVEQQGNAGTPGIGANIVGYNFDQRAIANWLSNNRFVELKTYNLHYPKFAGSKAPAVFVCSILNENVRKYLTSGQSGNLHNGLEIPIGRRTLAKWTYRNRYETPFPGKGNVKVFAGTLTYKIDPIVPIVSFTGEGTANVKMYLDPDNGRWTIDSWKMQDPDINLLTNPLRPSTQLGHKEDVDVRFLIFQLSPEKSKAQIEKNRNSIAGYFNAILKSHKDICFGIYAGNDSDKIIVQLTTLDNSIFQELLNYDKSQVSLNLDYRSLKGTCGFKFSDRGVLVTIRTRSVYSYQELLKRFNLSNESHVQAVDGGHEYLVWINKADYSTIKNTRGDIKSFFKEKFQNEDFEIRLIIENIEDKYTRR